MTTSVGSSSISLNEKQIFRNQSGEKAEQFRNSEIATHKVSNSITCGSTPKDVDRGLGPLRDRCLSRASSLPSRHPEAEKIIPQIPKDIVVKILHQTPGQNSVHTCKLRLDELYARRTELNVLANNKRERLTDIHAGIGALEGEMLGLREQAKELEEKAEQLRASIIEKMQRNILPSNNQT